ncbi:nickel-dependent hydrogenase large subunit, partial [Salmonella enterica subsp. enterica serovar Kentucky]|nr:nickel-dependent hydrogenase large subunit [Salmonella enterica subsp. enterica serovar Kentucky]
PATGETYPKSDLFNKAVRKPKPRTITCQKFSSKTPFYIMIGLAIPDQPLEILRTLHSFDPCLACSTHVLGDDGSELIAVQVR